MGRRRLPGGIAVLTTELVTVPLSSHAGFAGYFAREFPVAAVPSGPAFLFRKGRGDLRPSSARSTRSTAGGCCGRSGTADVH